jgi:dGTPase
LLGLLKYPVLRSAALNPAVKPALSAGPTTIGVLDGASAKPAKSCYDCDANVLDWVLSPFSQEDRERFSELSFAESKHAKTMHKSFDCSIMDMADDIAYGVHDLEDAAALNLIDESDWRRAVDELVCSELLNSLAARPVEGVEPTYDGLIAALFGSAGVRKRVIGRLVHSCIAATSVDRVEGFAAPLLSHRLTMREEPRALLQALRDLISNVVIQGARVQHLDFKGQRMVLACFEALVSAPERLLPRSTYVTFDTADGDLRIVSDYVACMTDAGLLRLYDRLFSPRMGTIFDRL